MASQSVGGGESCWVNGGVCMSSGCCVGIFASGSLCVDICFGSSTSFGLDPSRGDGGLSEGFVVSEQGVVWAMNSDRARGAGLCGVWRLLGDVLLAKSMVALTEGLSSLMVGVGGARGDGSTGLGRQTLAKWTGRCVSA